MDQGPKGNLLPSLKTHMKIWMVKQCAIWSIGLVLECWLALGNIVLSKVNDKELSIQIWAWAFWINVLAF